MNRMLKQLYAANVVGCLAEVAVCVALGAVLATVLEKCGVNAEFQAFLPGVALACWLRGFVGAVVSGVLSAIALWYFFIPPPGFALPGLSDTAHLLVFLGVAIFICRIITGQRETNEELVRENFELGYKVFLLRQIRRGSGGAD